VRKHATPLWSLRVRHARCEAGPWSCWRRATIMWPFPACPKHWNSELMQLGRLLYRSRFGAKR
jgi:hypothetical protein